VIRAMSNHRTSPPRSLPTLGIIALLVASMVACSEGDARSEKDVKHITKSNATLDRTIQRNAPRQLWARGGSAADSAFSYPVFVSAESSLVYVSDAGAQHLIALDAATGRTQWRTPASEDAPGALTHPGAISIVPGGGVAAVDVVRRAVQFYEPSGRAGSAVQLFKLSPIQSLCVLRDSALLISGVPGPTPLARVDYASQLPTFVAMPWSDLNDAPRLRTQTWLASDGHGACATTLALGRGFAVYDGQRFGTPADYVEWFELPAIVSKRASSNGVTTVNESLDGKRTAALDAILRDTEVWIPFKGVSERAAHLIDVYDRGTGNYRHSFTLPDRITSAAANRTTLFILTVREGYPALVAYDVANR